MIKVCSEYAEIIKGLTESDIVKYLMILALFKKYNSTRKSQHIQHFCEYILTNKILK